MALCSTSGDGGGPELTDIAADIAAGQPKASTIELPTRKQARRKALETSQGECIKQHKMMDQSDLAARITPVLRCHVLRATVQGASASHHYNPSVIQWWDKRLHPAKHLVCLRCLAGRYGLCKGKCPIIQIRVSSLHEDLKPKTPIYPRRWSIK